MAGRTVPVLHNHPVVVAKHSNADGLSRIPEELGICNCYEAGEEVGSLPCCGCPYYTKLHMQWGKFEEEVDYAVPQVVRQLRSPRKHAGPTDMMGQ